MELSIFLFALVLLALIGFTSWPQLQKDLVWSASNKESARLQTEIGDRVKGVIHSAIIEDACQRNRKLERLPRHIGRVRVRADPARPPDDYQLIVAIVDEANGHDIPLFHQNGIILLEVIINVCRADGETVLVYSGDPSNRSHKAAFGLADLEKGQIELRLPSLLRAELDAAIDVIN